MKRLLLILTSFAWIPFIAEEVRGCTCIEYDVPVCAAYWRADAVFAGQLVDITPVEKKSDNEMPTVMLHFIVEQPFRGVVGDRVDVETLHGTSCDMKFEKGERYLIYASRGKDTNKRVQIAKNQCHYRQLDAFKIDLHATAEVSGNVLNASGRAVSSGYVYLVNAADSNDSEFKKLEDNGSFKFEGVAVGEYYLVLNPRNEAPDENDAPYPRTYYPNMPEAAAATKIVVTEGAKLENLTLHVGPRWKERIVTGKVVLQDGSTPHDAHVSLYDGDRYIRLIKLDEKGRFNFKVYGDFKYAILAEASGKDRGKSERVSITNEKSTGLKLVLKRVD